MLQTTETEEEATKVQELNTATAFCHWFAVTGPIGTTAARPGEAIPCCDAVGEIHFIPTSLGSAGLTLIDPG